MDPIFPSDESVLTSIMTGTSTRVLSSLQVRESGNRVPGASMSVLLANKDGSNGKFITIVRPASYTWQMHGHSS